MFFRFFSLRGAGKREVHSKPSCFKTHATKRRCAPHSKTLSRSQRPLGFVNSVQTATAAEGASVKSRKKFPPSKTL
jgi:hypothetical protein